MENLKSQLQINNPILMYVGNLETYQGIDLLLESFALVLQQTDKIDLVIIGGEVTDIQKYEKKATVLGIETKVHFCGAKPTNQLSQYLAQADILVSPRIKGKNTPMKIYSYLDSGKAVLATDLLTHTQVIDRHVAMLAQPNAEDFAQGMLTLINNPPLRATLALRAKQLIQDKHSYQAFSQKLNTLYDWLKDPMNESQVQARWSR
ncbi:MAG: glycosyltransferase family 4 protein [Pleurocapsa sp.]